MNAASINNSAHQFWKVSGYSESDVNSLCADLDGEVMAARVTFHSGGVEFAITRRTWERQEGHYPTMARFVEAVARHPALSGIQGSLIIWLEDGFWEWQQKYSARAPILSFGRHRTDLRTFLIPDPAFLGSDGYQQEKQDLMGQISMRPWDSRSKKVFWRGAATGINIETEEWIKTARGRLTLLAAELDNPDVLDAKITKVSHLNEMRQSEMAARGVLGEQVEFGEFLKHRYLADADGYCCAWRSLALKLASGSTVLKIHSDYEQWYFGDLIPWVHYVPLRPDLADFEEAYTWLVSDDGRAHAIAKQGRDLINRLSYERSVKETAELCARIISCERIVYKQSPPAART